MKGIINNIYNFAQTTVHKFWVFWYIVKACFCLLRRAFVHDFSKYSKEEAPYFAKNIFKLKHTTYGTSEYQKLLDEIRPALEHHYKNNSHHPEFWENGVADMSPLDQIEMICDWKAASLRHKNGSVYYSIVQNAKRFSYSVQKQKAYIRAANEMFK